MTVGVFDVFFAFLAFVDLSLEVVEAVVLSQMRQFGGLTTYKKGRKHLLELALVLNWWLQLCSRS